NLRLQQTLSLLEHPVAVVVTFVGLQLRRSTDPFHTLVPNTIEGAFTSGHLFRDLRIRRILERVAPFHIDDPIPSTAAALRLIAQAAESHGARPIFLVVSYGPDRPLPAHAESEIITALFGKSKAPYALVDLDGPETLADDSRHPNRQGTEKLARAALAAFS